MLDRNLLEIPVDDIDSTDVLKTVFSGRVVYEKGVDPEPEEDPDGVGSGFSPVGDG